MRNGRERASVDQWLILLSVMISIGWLIPNHYKPWTSFHTESWIGLGLILFALQAIARGSARWRVNWPTVIVLAVTPIPLLQYVFGIVTWSGHAWVSTLYLAGFGLAVLVGSNFSGSQKTQCVNTLFLAIGLAASLSVGLQLMQWVGLETFDMWVMNVGRARPSANFGQPNQLATLQVWGVIAVGWWWHKGRVGGLVAIAWAAFLIFGISLTQSRTAWLNIGVLLVLANICQHLPKMRQIRYGLMLLAIWLIVCVFFISWVNSVFISSETIPLASRLQESLRPQAWKMFTTAVLEHPLIGYGWEQSGQAHLAMALTSPKLAVHFGQAHNLFLDFVIWTGLPIGLAITGALFWFLWHVFRRLDHLVDVLLFGCILVVGIHAMLELPLHYAYLLVPCGFFMGILSGQLTPPNLLAVSKRLVSTALLLTICLYAAIVRDYFVSEARFREMLHEKAHIGTNHPKLLPDVLLLNQMKAIIELAYYEPISNAEPWRARWAERITLESPSMANFYKLALIFALNGQPNQTTEWLRRGCAVLSAQDCTNLSVLWAQREKNDPNLAGLFPVNH